jgi:glycine hydroxymethyltransferase
MAAFFALAAPGDRIMGMSLDHGGHLTHGSPVNFSGKLYEFGHYGVDPDSEALDYDEVQRQAEAFRPSVIIAGYTAYPLTIDFKRFREIADSVGAALLVDMAHIAGLIAGGAHPSPVGLADIVTTTTHKTLRGPRGAMALMTKALARKYNSAVFPNMQGGPMEHVIAAKAVAFREAMRPEFKDYAHQIVQNAKALASGLSAGGLRIVAGGTENHLMLVDTRPLGLTGRDAEAALIAAGLVVNKNAIPFDPEPPMVTSGVRIGTPALTSRQLNVTDMEQVAGYILEALRAHADESKLSKLGTEVAGFASKFPVPGLDS